MNARTVLFVACLVVTAALSQPGTDRALAAAPARMIDVIAHRGAHEHAPENTLPAFQAAIDLGVDWVEIDVGTTADNHMVVLHDRTVDRVTNGTGALREKTLAEVRALDAGVRFDSSFAGTRIPTADEALALMRGKVQVYLEVKEASPDSIIALLRRHDMLASTIVYDDIAALAAMRQIEPRVRLLVPRPPKDLAALPALAARLHPAFFGSSYAEITSEISAACHAVGALVDVNNMRADNPEGWQYTIDRGGDGLETDRPAALLAFLRERGLHR